MVHGIRNHWVTPAEPVPTETLRGERRAGVSVIGVRKVVEDGKVYRVDADGRAADGYGWKDPVLGWGGGPAEPKHADWQAEAEYTGGVEARFGIRG